MIQDNPTHAPEREKTGYNTTMLLQKMEKIPDTRHSCATSTVKKNGYTYANPSEGENNIYTVSLLTEHTKERQDP